MQLPELGLFSMDFILKVFMGAYVWTHITFDKAKKPLLDERRVYLKAGNNEGFKYVIAKMEKLEEECFQCAMLRIKEKTQITEENFVKTLQFHLADPENQKKLEQLEERAEGYFAQIKAHNA